LSRQESDLSINDAVPVHPTGQSSTIDQLAVRHGISRGLIYKMIKLGKGPKLTKFLTRTMVTAEDEAAWLASLKQDRAA